MSPTGYPAAIDRTNRTGVLGELGQSDVIALGLHVGPDCCIFLRRIALFLVARQPAFLRHKSRFYSKCLASLIEGHAHQAQQFQRLIIGRSCCDNCDVHPLISLNLFQLDLRENRLVG